jgi:hypothetical protein
MYRYNEGTDFVVHVANVNLIIPTTETLTTEQQNEKLAIAHADYLKFIADGGKVLAQEELLP